MKTKCLTCRYSLNCINGRYCQRAERYKEPEVCRVYSKKEKVRQYLPILDWTSEDISEFVSERVLVPTSLMAV